MRGEPIFQTDPGMTKPIIQGIELASATAEGAGCNPALTEGKARHEAAGNTVHEVMCCVLSECLPYNPDITGDEVVQARASAEPAIAKNPVSRMVIDGVFPERGPAKGLQSEGVIININSSSHAGGRARSRRPDPDSARASNASTTAMTSWPPNVHRGSPPRSCLRAGCSGRPSWASLG